MLAPSFRMRIFEFLFPCINKFLIALGLFGTLVLREKMDLS